MSEKFAYVWRFELILKIESGASYVKPDML